MGEKVLPLVLKEGGPGVDSYPVNPRVTSNFTRW